MKEIAEYTGMIGVENVAAVTSGIVRILLAAICGAVIGTERGRKHRPAGLRTHMLVCVAAALVMVTNEQLIEVYGSGDPTRMGAQVISGIGFLGAGTIITDRQSRIRGLTTAAGLWASACVGLAIGSGYYLGGVLTCIFILIIFTKFIGIEKHFVKRSRTMEIRVSFENAKSLNHFISELTSCECNVVSFEVFGKNANLQIVLPAGNCHEEVTRVFNMCKGMLTLEEL